jgi:hypothetical protein
MTIAHQILILVVFVIWCYVGLVWFGTPQPWRLIRAITFGLIRSVLLFVFRFFLYYASTAVESLQISTTVERTLVYLFLYIPSVWIEWCIIAGLMRSQWSGVKEFLLGPWKPSLKWKSLGTVLTLALEFPQSFLWQALLWAMSS